MMLKFVKSNGKTVDFDYKKFTKAIKDCFDENSKKINAKDLKYLVSLIYTDVTTNFHSKITNEEMHNIIVKHLKENKYEDMASKFTEAYENKRHFRYSNMSIMKDIKSVVSYNDRDNANVGNNFAAKLLRIASNANKWHLLNDFIPKKFASAHMNGDIYIHDLDSYNLTINCLQHPTGKLLQEGFNCGYGYINSPKSIETAADLTCIMLQSGQNDMFGGQGHPNFDNDLAPFVKITYDKILAELKEMKAKDAVKIAKSQLVKRVSQAMQAVVYNLNTMHSRGGGQVPFSSINLGIPDNEYAAMVCQAFLEEYNKGLGNGEQPIFPNIIFRVKKGVNANPGDPYYYLFQIACHVASQRMNPTFMNIDADFNKEYYDHGYMPATMGCRTYVMSNINGEPGNVGRGNIAPVTINIVRLAILAKNNISKFFSSFDDMIELCREQLLHRYDTLKNLKVSDLPFVAGQHIMIGSENLEPDDSIEPILIQGTWSIGFIGLAETLKILLGKHHGESEEAQELGIKIVSYLRDKCDEFKTKYHLNFTCYATPAEGLSNKFTISDEKKFGPIDWITTKGFYTNSFHVPVDYPISYTDKIRIEAPYHKICNAGHISYVEFDSQPTGTIIEKIIRYAYNNTNINYIGFNFHIRYCLDCIKNARHAHHHSRLKN